MTAHWKHLSALAFLSLVMQATGSAQDKIPTPPEDHGTLVVLITWGDINNTPADDVYIEAHGYVQSLQAEKSYVLLMAKPGRYEVSLPPGVFDVFVSEGDSVPRCKRVLIRPGSLGYWTLKLETDEIYTLR